MKHHDLGALKGAIMLFGGPYSNLPALNALIAVAQARGIAASNMICTGDVVAYCASPAETVARIRHLGCPIVAGNCEKQLAVGAVECGCSFEAGSACDLLSVGWFGHASVQIDAPQRDWMAGLPDIVMFNHHGARYGVIHGGVTDVARFIWSTSDPKVFEAEWQAAEAQVGPLDHIVSGHSGLPFKLDTVKGAWINAGVIGIPAHDGSRNTHYAVLDAGETVFHELDYDVAKAVSGMQAAGLTQGYDRSLETGYWPTEDVLPLLLRARSLRTLF